MTSDHALYRDLAYVFIAALLGGVIAKRLRQPLIIGYVLGGIFIGPFTPGPTISDIHVLELFAEIGVILLMYSIGIEFSIRDLLQVKWVSLVGGPLGILGRDRSLRGDGAAVGLEYLAEHRYRGRCISREYDGAFTPAYGSRGTAFSTRPGDDWYHPGR